MSKGFPPAINLYNDRKKYYNALDQSNHGNYSKLLHIHLQAIERSLDIYLSHIYNQDDDYQDISFIAQEPDIPYGSEYISL